jgi:hypothetical protein
LFCALDKKKARNSQCYLIISRFHVTATVATAPRQIYFSRLKYQNLIRGPDPSTSNDRQVIPKNSFTTAFRLLSRFLLSQSVD